MLSLVQRHLILWFKVYKMALVKTNLENIDIEKLYIQQIENSTFKSKKSEDWDKKAHSMNKHVHKSLYTKEFISKIDTNSCESMLDIGCGPGTICLAMASLLKEIYALDYSIEMLNCVKENSKNLNINNIKTIHKSWYENWDEIPNADIVIASRSMMVKDIKKALQKLNEKANKRVYLTTKVGGSFIDNEILNQLKRDIIPRPDYIYLLNVLHSMGIYAKVDFIKSENNKLECLNSKEFIEKISWSLGELSNEENEILTNYFDTTYKNSSKKDFITWAFISWEK